MGQYWQNVADRSSCGATCGLKAVLSQGSLDLLLILSYALPQRHEYIHFVIYAPSVRTAGMPIHWPPPQALRPKQQWKDDFQGWREQFRQEDCQ